MGTPSPKRMIAYTRSTGATETSVMGNHRRCPQSGQLGQAHTEHQAQRQENG